MAAALSMRVVRSPRPRDASCGCATQEEARCYACDMRNVFDFSSWSAVLSTLLGLVIVTGVAVGIRLLVMQRVQQRRERQNRQINERLKTLIAAYKTLGRSFTGDLAVDPGHRRDQRGRAATPRGAEDDIAIESGHAERRRRIRDAVETALSDVILLGTADQVRLAAQAASNMVAGRKIETAALVVSLRDFIREVLDLDAVPGDLVIPRQGPARMVATGGRSANATRAEARGAAGNRGGGLATGGMLGVGVGAGQLPPDDDEQAKPSSGAS